VSTADDLLIERIRGSLHGSARVLCGLARRGKAIERDQPRRAARLLGAVVTHPLYKGGRLAFDMLEVEDVMLAEPTLAPPSLNELLVMVSVAEGVSGRAADLLARIAADGASSDDELPRLRLAPETESEPSSDELPELTAADYLFDYVVLGLLDVLSRRLA